MFKKSLTPLLIRVHQHLDVGPTSEVVATISQLPTQRFEIVDLAVGDEMDFAVLTLDRLLSPVDVDDREPAHRKTDARQHHLAFIVGTAMS